MATETFQLSPSGGASRPLRFYLCATTTDRDAVAGMREGEECYCADVDAFFGYDGSAWVESYSLVVGGGGSTPPTFDAASSAELENGSSKSFSHTVGSGSNRLLIVGISWYDPNSGASITSVVYNGTETLTKLDHANTSPSGDGRGEIWYRVNPSSGAHNIVVTFSTGGQYATIGAVSVADANQSTPFGTPAKATGTGTSASVNVTSADDELVIAVLDYASTSQTTTVTGTGTSRWTKLSSNTEAGAGQTAPGASSVTAGWTLSGSSAWDIIGVSIKPV